MCTIVGVAMDGSGNFAHRRRAFELIFTGEKDTGEPKIRPVWKEFRS